jgi:UDP-N-acetylmuramyl pentapeptide phosphotransferase/UDP-N-acetylglucosamine-1-phosphate transferase
MIESLIWHLNNFFKSEKLLFLPASITMSFVIGVLSIILFIPLLKKIGMVDNPSERRAHKNPTIRGGGIAFVIAFIFTFCFIAFFSNGRNISFLILIPVSILGIVSFGDDIKGMPILVRLLVHLFAAYLCIKFYFGNNLIFRGEIGANIDFFLAVLSLAAFINIYNFLDGIDGISAFQSIHLSLSAIILCIIRDKVIINVDMVFYISSILLGCSIGFLLFNWHPAKIFMGDVGSTFLGLLHGLNLLLIAASSERLFLAASIASLYYISDGGITILIRLMKGEKIWLPHLNHFFQQAVRKGMSHKEVVCKIGICNFILLILSVSSLYVPHLAIIFSILTVTYILVHFHDAK